MQKFFVLPMFVVSGLIMAAAVPTRHESNLKEFENIVRWQGETPVTTARCQVLLREGIGDINAPICSFGMTPLELTVSAVAPQFTSMLLEAGAVVHVAGRQSVIFSLFISETSPFCWHGRARFVQGCSVIDTLIQHGLNINVQKIAPQYPIGQTPLMALCDMVMGGGATVEAVQFLLERGADITIADQSGLRPIDYGLIRNNMPIVRLLAEKDLFRLVLGNNQAGVSLALRRGARIRNVRDAQGNTIFHSAARRIADQVSRDMFFYLMTLPIGNVSRYLNQSNNDGETPMQLLLQNTNDNAQQVVDFFWPR